MKRGKRYNIVKRNVAVGLLLGMLNSMLFADIKVDKNIPQKTSVDRAQNGANIININTPNNKGISVNDFSEFRTKDPTIFNNFGQGVGRSYLAGMMAANPNLTKEQAARLILNRVGGNNRVEIENWLEVMSENKTDIIFSSQNGFYLNNTGFINFDKAIFTTSRVDLDGNGDLLPFNIRGGKIEIGREGINAEGVRYLALLSRQMYIDGQIYAKDTDVDLIAGDFDYNPHTKDHTKHGVNNNELLISSSAFGSIYGNQIKIVGVNGNIGVAGDVISERVLKINADGTIVTNKTQAKEAMEIKAKEFVQEGSVYTEGKLTIEADKTTLKGSGTQASEIEISGNLDNNSNLYSTGNVTVGKDVKNKGQIISENGLDIKGSLDSDNLVYGRNEIRVGTSLVNKSDIQSEGNITVSEDTINTGRILSDKELNIKGNTVNQGTLYGKDNVKIEKNLNNTGSVQTTGEIRAKDTVNTGKLTAEGNISTDNLDNNGEIITNKKLVTKNLENKSTGKITTGEGIDTAGNAVNHGQINTNGSFMISSNLENYNIINVGGLVSTKDLTNAGTLKVSDKIVSKGFSFSNTGEIVTVNLDVDSTNIMNTNKITVVETSKLKGSSNVNNQGIITSKNIEITTPVLTNSGQILAEEVITANNTSLTNTGKLASNGSINLNNTSIVNRSSIESTTVNLQNVFSYDNNTGIIRGNNITLTSAGNLLLEGKIQGINNLLISGVDITNNGNTISSGLLRLSGRDITNNLTISAGNVELLATGNILNNSMIEGERGKLSGNNITNKDLIIFLDKLDIEGTKLVNKDASVYSDNELNISTGDVDNTGGEIVGQSELNITGFNLLDNTKGIIDSRGNILLSGNKLLNSGEVSGQYRLYWETWDGRIIYDDVWRNLDDTYTLTGNSSLITGLNEWIFSEGRSNMQGWGINPKDELDDINNDLDYKLYYGNLTSSQLNPTKNYMTQVLTGYIDTSRLVTEGGRILSGGNLTLDVIELENVNSKISSGGTLRITDKVQTIKNETTASTIKVYDGEEQVKTWELHWTAGNGDTRTGAALGVRRDLKTTGRDVNIADSVSVIEGNNVIIEGSPVISNGYVIQSGAVVDPSTITSKDVDVDLYYDPVTVHVDRTAVIDIITTGTIPFNPGVFTSSQSKLFAESKDPTSKYLMETRSQYIDLSRFYGSDYFLSRIGYNESNDWNMARRLGDAYYETKYMNNLLLETLGTRFINGKADTELMKEMLDNAVATSGDLQLTIGVALTGDQIAALKSDIIWYVEQEVNGEKVLVPQVYLSQATLENIKSPTTTISAQETLAINSSSLVNQGRLEGNTVYVNTDNLINKSVGALTAEITGTNIQIDAKNDILNIGAVIAAKENVVLTAGGTISNITTGVQVIEHDRLRGEERSYTADNIQNVGVISSGDTTYISGENYVSRGAVTQSEGTTYIEAEKDISINTINLRESEREGIKNGYQYTEVNQKLGSEVTGLDNVIMNAGNDINIKGSMVASDGTVQLTAENNINISNDKNTMYHEEKEEKKGTFSSYYRYETDYSESAVGSTLIGNNVILDAGNDVNIKASNVIAVKNDNIQSSGGNIIVTAGNNISITTDDMNNEYSLTEKRSGFSSSFSTGGGGISAGVSYSRSSLEVNNTSTTVAVSSIMSEGNTVLEAGNRVRTEAMQADIGENLVIRGVNGVELLDAKEVYEEKVKQKSTTIGVNVNVGFTPAQLASTISDVADNMKDYGFGNSSQSINTIGNGIQDLRDVTQLGSKLYDAALFGAVLTQGLGQSKLAQLGADKLAQSNNMANGQDGLIKSLVSANVSLSYSQSKYESNINGTTSVAGVINVGKNFLIESEGDVKLVNQKINVGENFIVDAKNFEALAGVNTYNNDTKSSSGGANIGYDLVNNHIIGGANISGGNSNGSSKYYDNTIINAGGTFQLTTKEDATFAGANVTADKINFDIGKNLSIISLQDESKSEGKNYGVGVDVSGKLPGTNKEEGYAIPSLNGNYSQNNADSKWVNNQTSIIAENGGSVKVGETLTNIGSIIGSLNEEEKLSIDANKIVVENLKDHDQGENSGIQLSGISKDTLIPQTGIQYGSHDKQQDSNATFVNTEVTEAGKKLDLEELGINTDIKKAQVITKDEMVEQIDTVLHTDLGNQKVRDQFVEDILKTGSLVPEIVAGIKEGLNNDGQTVAGQIANNLIENKDDIHSFVTDRDNKQKEKNKELLDKNNGELSKELLDETTKFIKETLDAAGKGDYTVVYSEGGDDPAMSINDSKKIIVVNVDKTDFTDTEAIRQNAQHEGSHNRYIDEKVDENAAPPINVKNDIVNNIIPNDLEELLEKGKEVYDEGVESGEIRGAGCVYVSGSCISNSDYAKKTNVWKDGKGSDAAISIALDFVPVVGDVKGIIEAVRGKDILTNEELSTLERLLSLIALGEIKGIAKGSKKAIKSIKMLGKSDEIVMVLSDGTKVVAKKSDIAKAAIKNSDEAASVTKVTLRSSKEEIQNYIVKQKLDTSGWAKDFPKSASVKATAESSIAYHFKKHGAEVGADSVEQYMRKAEAFSKNLRGSKSFKVVLGDGTSGMRHVKNGKYIILDEARRIVSFGTIN